MDAALAHLFRMGARSQPGDLPSAIEEVTQRWWGAASSVWIVDHEQQHLVPLVGPLPPHPERHSIEGTMAGRAYISGEPVTATDVTGLRIWLPMAHGADRIGVLELEGPPRLGGADLAALGELADLVAALVVLARPFTDELFRRRRRRRMTLAADMQWSQLPPSGGHHGHTTYAGLLEPAYGVAGDVFDYVVNDGLDPAPDGDVLHAAIFDAVGHNLSSAIVSHLVLGSYRHARRQRLTMLETHRFIDDVVAAEIGHSRFATGLITELALRTGHLRIMNCGHPLPLLVRHGKAVTLEARPTWPLGLGGEEPEIAEYVLEPDDRLLLYTDGIVEGRTPEGDRFSEDTLADQLVKATASDLSTAETLRRLIYAVLSHQEGDLRDDGTMVLIDWHPS